MRVPRLSITLVSEKLARKSGALGLNFQPVTEHAGELPSSSDDSSSVNDSADAKSESECREDKVVCASYSIPDKDQFSLLHSNFSLNQGHNLLNQLLNELG